VIMEVYIAKEAMVMAMPIAESCVHRCGIKIWARV